MEQAILFNVQTKDKLVDKKQLTMFALGEFQSRGKLLADRELALDRLRGAFRRASEIFQTNELSDEEIAEGLQMLGAKIVRIPSFVAKHPFRVTVKLETAERALLFYVERIKREKL